MKKIILLFSFMLIGISTQGQEVKKNKNAKVAFEVDGICGMCKKRIETAALKTKGVKFALWDIKTHQLNLIVDERKTAVTTIQKNILKVGHDVKGIKAT
ncbi:heavy-metal-associated domain-containing protein, partial [Polaribacter sp.]|nr:heavy-metal-associated domain-containing protein [Polaribacter sp.]